MSRSNPPPKPDTTNGGRNEYIPQYISAKPFYAEDLLKDTEYLSHQRSKAEQKDTLDKAKWYSRTKTAAATKYRKGACENCGAMHPTKDCLSRKRKTGAKYTGRDIQADDVVEDVQLGWDAKRDRWNGYDVREYDAVVRDYADMEALRAKDDSHYEDGDVTRNQPPSTRQLRLREDTANYLLDLNEDSAKYDPKTRTLDGVSVDVASEGFVRPEASDAAAFERAQRFAWEKQEKPETPNAPIPAAKISDSKVHLEANPTASALAHRKNLEEVEEKKAQQKDYLKSKYGDSEELVARKPLVAASTSQYVEYDPETGREIDRSTGKPMIKPVARSKYAEDVFPGNHASVFGSYWCDGQWGFKCCHSFVKNSYCTGEAGKKGFEEEQARRLGMDLITDGKDPDTDESKKRKADDIDPEREKRQRTEEVF